MLNAIQIVLIFQFCTFGQTTNWKEADNIYRELLNEKGITCSKLANRFVDANNIPDMLSVINIMHDIRVLNKVRTEIMHILTGVDFISRMCDTTCSNCYYASLSTFITALQSAIEDIQSNILPELISRYPNNQTTLKSLVSQLQEGTTLYLSVIINRKKEIRNVQYSLIPTFKAPQGK